MTQALQTGSPTGSPTGEHPFGAFEYFPDNLEWSTQMMRLIAYCYVRGADFSEVHAVARTLPVGDDAAWQMGFSGLAEQIEASARASAAGGHEVTARDFFLRASTYHRISGQLADIAGDTDVPPGAPQMVVMMRVPPSCLGQLGCEGLAGVMGCVESVGRAIETRHLSSRLFPAGSRMNTA